MLRSQIKRAEKRCATLAAEIGDLVEGAWDEPDAEGNQVARPLTADEQAKWEALVAEYTLARDSRDALKATERMDKAESERTEILGAKGAWQVDLQAHKDMMEVAGETYLAKRVPAGGHPKQLELAAPFIEFDRKEGRNMVRPFGVVYGKADHNGERTVDLEATFRAADMLASGAGGKFDPSTGRRLEADLTTVSVPGAIPTLSMALYEYMITMNRVGQFVNVLQTSGINDYQLARRTTVPKATIIGTAANSGQGVAIGEQESGFGAAVVFKALKYAFLTQYSYEMMQTIDVFNIASQVVRDGGIGLSNGIGEHLVNGTGTANNQPEGIKTYVAANSTSRVAGIANGQFPRAFTPAELMKLVGSPEQAYYLGSMWRIMCLQETYVGILAITGTDGHGVYRNYENVFDQALNPQASSVLLDKNVDAPGANKEPLILSDFQGYTMRLAGGPRVDMSDHHAFGTDEKTVRFIQHADGHVIDPNCFKGYRTS